jgi:hypothetical protein
VTRVRPRVGEGGVGAMTTERTLRGRAARLSLWNRLFRGLPVGLGELDSGVLCGDLSSPDECAAYVTLRACAALAASERQAVRCALRIAILYWFSNIGEHRGDARGPLQPKRRAFHLGEAIGTGLTWDEAVAMMNRKPVDFSAYLWLLEVLETEYAIQWSATFPGTAPAPIDALSGQIQKSEHAKQWSLGPESAPKGDRSGRGGEDSA